MHALAFIITLALVAPTLVASAPAHAQAPAQSPAPSPRPPVAGPGRTPQRDRTLAPPATGTARIRGIVTADSGTPLRHAVVRVTGPALPGARTVTTNATGQYEITDLAAGDYTLSASKPGFVTLQYGQPRAFEPAKPIDLRDGQTVDRANFILPRGGVVTGRVVDELGEPVADAAVIAMRYEYVRGRRRVNVASMGNRGPARTNDLGEFRLAGLAPADYLVSATLGGAFNDAPATGPTAYAQTYFPGAATVAEAQTVIVSSGRDATADITLIPARLVHVSGSILDSQGRPASGGMVRLDQQGDVTASGRLVPLNPDGSFSIELVAMPGSYVLTVATSGQKGAGPQALDREFGRMPVAIGADDVTGLVVTTRPGATVSGEIVLEGRAAPPPGLRVAAQPLDADDARAGGSVPVNADGTFELKNVYGRSLVFADIPSGTSWRVKAVSLDGEDITDTGIDPGDRPRLANLKVVLTNAPTEVAGTVTATDGQPRADSVVLLFAEDEAKWRHPLGRYIQVTRADTAGRYSVTALPAGRYFAVALDTIESGATTDPAVLARLRPAADSVTVRDGSTTSSNLHLLAR